MGDMLAPTHATVIFTHLHLENRKEVDYTDQTAENRIWRLEDRTKFTGRHLQRKILLLDQVGLRLSALEYPLFITPKVMCPIR